MAATEKTVDLSYVREVPGILGQAIVLIGEVYQLRAAPPLGQ